MNYFKCFFPGLDREIIFTPEMMTPKFMNLELLNHLGELGSDLVFWKLEGNTWVRLTREQFAGMFNLPCRFYTRYGRRDIGDYIPQGEEVTPLEPDWRTKLYKPRSKYNTTLRGKRTGRS